jgi:uncharacterized protein (TIGR02452 family)
MKSDPRREKLINVFLDTQKYCEENKLTSPNTVKYSKPELKREEDFFKPKNIKVINHDCVNTAKILEWTGKTCILNMASAKQRGGGVERGAMAQEEELCRRSNLWYALLPEYYPVGETDFIYSKNIKFFKDSEYNLINRFKCDVITVAAPNLRNLIFEELDEDWYFDIITEKIKQILLMPLQNKCENLVLSAFGCGVFRNDPLFISKMFEAGILENSLPYKNIVFAITGKKDNNENFETFYKTFKKYEQDI